MSNSEKINIKKRTCNYFDDIIKINDLALDNILVNGKSYENRVVCHVKYEAPCSVKIYSVKS